MAPKKPKVGDPVLWYGQDLQITELTTSDRGHELAVVEDVRKRDARAAAAAEFRALREEMSTHKGDWPAEVEARIEELRAAAAEGLFIVRIRRDLMHWWDEAGAWVADGGTENTEVTGRIMSDDQIERWQKLTGSKKRPTDQRAAYSLLVKMEG